MNLVCIICSDLFVPTADIYSTQCGHIFHYHCLLHWLENSKTCPQCRTKIALTNLVRLYVNVSNTEGITEDISVLQYKIDGLEFQLRLKDKDITNLTEKKKELKKQNVGLRLEVKKLEQKELTHETAIAALKGQLKFFKHKSHTSDILSEEVGKLKKQIKDMEHVQTVVNGSRKEVEDIIRNENSVESLALLASTLKKSLVDSDRKRKELQFQLNRVQNELSENKRAAESNKCVYEDTKRQLDSLKLNYEKEVKFLKNKFSNLESKIAKGHLNDSLNNSIRRITLESPVNYDRTPVLSSGNADFNLTPKKTNSTSQLMSDTVKSKSEDTGATTIVDLTSTPCVGALGIHRTSKFLNSPDHNKFSIFKNKQAPQFETMKFQPMTRDDVSYNGLGGSSKEDVFPTPQNISTGLKRPKTTKTTSAKFKKLSAEAGKTTRKVSDFF